MASSLSQFPWSAPFHLGPAWGRPLCAVMPKRKVTFQGVGDEEDDEDISVPKKKVRGPGSCIQGRSEGREKELEARREKGTKNT